MPDSDAGLLGAALMPSVLKAARIELGHRQVGEMQVDRKADTSPVTAADREAEAVLLEALASELPGVPVVAEERHSGGAALSTGSEYILVDPLDGTEDFVSGGSDFTINIGIISAGRPIFGLIYVPVTGDLYLTRDMKTAVTYAISPDAGMEDFRSSAPRRLQTRAPDPTALVALLSKRSGGSMQDDFLGRLTIARQQRMSSSVKFCLVARGDADLYPRFGPTSQWDTAAGHAILNAAGGCVTDLSGAPLRYGSPDVNIFNQPFVAWGRSPH